MRLSSILCMFAVNLAQRDSRTRSLAATATETGQVGRPRPRHGYDDTLPPNGVITINYARRRRRRPGTTTSALCTGRQRARWSVTSEGRGGLRSIFTAARHRQTMHGEDSTAASYTHFTPAIQPLSYCSMQSSASIPNGHQAAGCMLPRFSQ